MGVAGDEDAVSPGNQHAHQVGYGGALAGARHPENEGIVLSQENPAIVEVLARTGEHVFDAVYLSVYTSIH